MRQVRGIEKAADMGDAVSCKKPKIKIHLTLACVYLSGQGRQGLFFCNQMPRQNASMTCVNERPLSLGWGVI